MAFSAFAPPADWLETEQRFEAYRRANMNLKATVHAYVEHLRAQYGISQRDLVAHGSTDARQSRAAHHELVSIVSFELILSSTRSVRPSKDERGQTHARGPPWRSTLMKCQTPHLARPAREIAPSRLAHRRHRADCPHHAIG